MKRLAIFVEGQTEQLFVAKLLKEIAGESNIEIQEEKYITSLGSRIATIISGVSATTDKKYYALIRDCGGDSSVKTDIIDACESMYKIGYNKIIGLLDVYPKPREDIPKFKLGLKYGVPTKFAEINIVLSVMELESWFLGEASHFERIHKDLTRELIVTKFGFDPFVDNMESRDHPSNDINNIYKEVGFAYNKRRKNALRTVNCLDYAYIYVELKNKMPSLNSLISEINSFMC